MSKTTMQTDITKNRTRERTAGNGKVVDGRKEMMCLCKLGADIVVDFKLLFPPRGESEDTSRSLSTSRGCMCIFRYTIYSNERTDSWMIP
jgi:hypothetical protein